MNSNFHRRALTQLKELQNNKVFHNFVAQAHSRNILQFLSVPESEWPDYSASLTRSLHDTAHFLLYEGLAVKESAEEDTETLRRANETLTLGAEILEFLYEHSENDDPERMTALIHAALGYYIAGHSARAFVLIKKSETMDALPSVLRLLRQLFLRDLAGLRQGVFSILLDDGYRDEHLVAAMADSGLDEAEIIERALLGGFCKALSYFLEHAKTGDEELFTRARELLNAGIELSKQHHSVDWWWLLWCTDYLLNEYHDRSLWVNLLQWSNDDLIHRYVEANYTHPTPVLEFWPSQMMAVSAMAEGLPQSYCVKMPTSAGKTKVAELSILRFLLDNSDPKTKCIYVAPFRSLAVEVEKTLRSTFHRLGARVSELYGGFEMGPIEQMIIEDARVLVATPEKFDAILRYVPDLLDQIKLIIVDEGHIINPPNFKRIRHSRGLKYEVFLHRLVNRFSKHGTPIVFVSAVLPNTEQFAEWITGDSGRVIQSDWRPSRLMLGTATWTGRAVNINFSHVGTTALEYPCFVNRFVEQIPGAQIPGRRRRPFPADIREALASTALDFANKGMTLVFEARKRSVQSLGDVFLQAIEIRKALGRSTGSGFGLPISPEAAQELRQCAALARETMGDDSPVAKYLEEGFVVHHGDLPQQLRLELERLVRAGHVRLVIATTTLAQGVNFPVRTIVVHGLQHDQDEPVDPMTFWNICGRAGRGMKENEGQVLFMVQGSADEWAKAPHRKWARKLRPRVRQAKWKEWSAHQAEMRAHYISSYGNYSVESALRSVLLKLRDLWKQGHGIVDYEALCGALASNNIEPFGADPDIDVSAMLNTLDGLIIALTEESTMEDATFEDLHALLDRSLMFLQSNENGRRRTTEMLYARLRYIRDQHPDRTQRMKLYRLGLPLNDCNVILANRDRLLKLYKAAANYQEWPITTRVRHIAEIASFLLGLQEIKPDHPVPNAWVKVLERWLSGESPNDMIVDPAIARDFQDSPTNISRFIDDVFTYRLPWGLNTLHVYLSSEIDAPDESLPENTSYYSAMVKLGVHDAVACMLLALGLASRAAALRIAHLVPEEHRAGRTLRNWLRNLSDKDMDGLGLTAEDKSILLEAQRQLTTHASSSGVERFFERTVRSPHGAILQPGDRLVIHPEPERSSQSYSLYTLNGEFVGRYRTSLEELPHLWDRPDRLDVTVVAVVPDGDTYEIVLVIRAI